MNVIADNITPTYLKVYFVFIQNLFELSRANFLVHTLSYPIRSPALQPTFQGFVLWLESGNVSPTHN